MSELSKPQLVYASIHIEAPLNMSIKFWFPSHIQQFPEFLSASVHSVFGFHPVMSALKILAS